MTLSIPLADRYGRIMKSLRISLTDRCNFRCSYCMPEEGVKLLPQDTHLTRDEIIRFVQIACGAGIEKIRITGGEPLLRNDVVDIVRGIAAVSGLKDLALTTNGSRLAPLAAPLRAAGLKRVNVSLDSLNRDEFKKIAMRDCFDQTMDGLLAALACGLAVKVNVVVMNGINDREIEDFIEFALKNSFDELRFIEFMPLCGTGWKPELVKPFTPVIQGLKKKYVMEPMARSGGDVARSYVVHSGTSSARIGFITTLSEPFCSDCQRIRLSADGEIRSCLFSHEGVSVRQALRSGADDGVLEDLLRLAVLAKPAGNEFARAHERNENLGSLLRQPLDRSVNPVIRSIGG